jgi:hypothetical protein
VAAPVPSPAPRLTGLAVRASGRKWTATFRASTRAVVRGRLARGKTTRTLAARTFAAGTRRIALGTLAPGAYRLTLTATAGGRTATATRSFTVRAT